MGRDHSKGGEPRATPTPDFLEPGSTAILLVPIYFPRGYATTIALIKRTISCNVARSNTTRRRIVQLLPLPAKAALVSTTTRRSSATRKRLLHRRSVRRHCTIKTARWDLQQRRCKFRYATLAGRVWRRRESSGADECF